CKQYAEYCASPVMPFTKAWDEFAFLCALPEVEKVTFCRGDDGMPVLLVGTSDVYLKDNESLDWHHIGQFVIAIQRRKKDSSVEYFNLTQRIVAGDKAIEYHHPHMYGSKL